MKKQILQFPFFQIELLDQTKQFELFFEKYFFPLEKYPSVKFTLQIVCQVVEPHPNVISVEDTAFSDAKHFYVKDTQGKYARIDFSDLTTSSWKISVDPAFDAYYLYTFIIEPVVIITLLSHNIGFLHASALFHQKNDADIYTAWQNTGKTHLLLSLLKNSFSFMSDDYCLLYNSQVFAYPKKINLFSYNLQEFTHLYKQLSLLSRIKLFISLNTKKILHKFSLISRGSFSKVFFRMAELAEVSTNIQVAPSQLGVKVQTEAKVHRIYLVERSLQTQTVLKPADIHQVHTQLLQIILYEQRDFFSIYQKYKFLFPDKKNVLIDSFSKNYFDWLKQHIHKVSVLNLGTDTASFHQQFLSKKL